MLTKTALQLVFRLVLGLLLAVGLPAPRAEAVTYSIVGTQNGFQFSYYVQEPRLIRKVPLNDGMRWELAVSNKRRYSIRKVLETGPVSILTMEQKGNRATVTMTWRFPVSIVPTLSPSRFQLLIPYTVTRKTSVVIAKGVQYERIHRWTPAGPLLVNLVQVDLRHAAVRPQLAKGPGFRAEPVSAIAKRFRALAAVNGSFFIPSTKRPVGLLVLDGQIVSSSFFNRSVFGIRHDGSCFIDNARLFAAIGMENGPVFIANGVNQPPGQNRMVLYTSHYGERTGTVPDPSRREFAIASDGTVLSAATGNMAIPRDGYVLSGQGTAIWNLKKFVRIGSRALVYSKLTGVWEGVKWAIGGGPTLVDDGQVRVTAREERFGPEIAKGRAPRTAIGYLGDQKVLLVTVDGRASHSVGMTLYELARMLRDLGVSEAINLDGGGSTTMVVRDRVMNRVSDGWERSVNNALVVVPRRGD